MPSRPPTSVQPTTTLTADYLYGAAVEQVNVLGFTERGLPIVLFPSGSIEVVERHRVRVRWSVRRPRPAA
jgi:hypothetical protein